MPARGEQLYECGLLTGPAAIAEAKRLQGQAFVRHGHLPPQALTAQGWLPWHDRIDAGRVRWFGAYSAAGDLAAVARKISSDGTGAGYPAWGEVSGFTERIRAAGRDWHGTADFLDGRS
ncbi:hypothetical protein OHA21_10170 [Actinoplanes sp. NBC_00393]|uniref:hypothetical protein n=1 Tax=Actinoplanes sp. NBC_00393 TaxID=2975953 RepID=UPI002E1E93BD